MDHYYAFAGPRPPHRQFVPGMMPPMPHEQVMVAEKHEALRSTLADLGNDKMIKALDDLRMILQMIMQDCSRANIEAGKTWSFEYCCHPARAEALIDFILALSLSKPTFEERLHLLYLINDVLFHCIRRQLPWMKELILHRLVPLLRTVYHCPGANEMTKAKVNKVMTIWGDKNFFAPNIIHSIRENVYIPPPPHMPVLGPPPGMPGMMPGFRPPFVPPGAIGPMGMPPMEGSNPAKMPTQMPPHLGVPPRPHPSRGMGVGVGGGSYLPPTSAISTPIPTPGLGPGPGLGLGLGSIPTSGKSSNPTTAPAPPPIPASPPKRYYELPAGWMVTAHKNTAEPYTPIDPVAIQQHHQQSQKNPSIANYLKAPLEDFYDGLDLNDHSDTFEENTDGRVDRNGWEPDYLKGFYERIKAWSSSRHGRDGEKTEGKRKRRGSSRHSDSYRRRSRRYPDERSPSRGRSPNKYKGNLEKRRHQYRSSSRSHSRGRSSSGSRGRGRSHSNSRSRSRSHSRSSRGSRSRSHSRSRSNSSRSRSRSRSSRSRSRSLSRSRSHSRSRSRSRSQSRSRSHSRSRAGRSYSSRRSVSPVGFRKLQPHSDSKRFNRHSPPPFHGSMEKKASEGWGVPHRFQPAEEKPVWKNHGSDRDGRHKQTICQNCFQAGHSARECKGGGSSFYPAR